MFQQVKKRLSGAKSIIWVTNRGVECQKPLNAIITGLARSIRSKNRLSRSITLDTDSSQESPESVAEILSRIVGDALAAPRKTASEFEYAVRNRLILIPRLIEDVELSHHLNSGQEDETPRIETFFQRG